MRSLYTQVRMTRQKIIITLTIVIFLLSNCDARRRRVDCTKFVFAPVCRGIAAKREAHFGSAPHKALQNSDMVGLVRDDNRFASPSLADKKSLYDLLVALPKMEMEYDHAGSGGRLHTSRKQDIAQENVEPLIRWMGH